MARRYVGWCAFAGGTAAFWALLGACAFEPTVSIQQGGLDAVRDGPGWDGKVAGDGAPGDALPDVGDAGLTDAAPSCRGTCQACDGLDEASCGQVQGCRWASDSCDGNCVPCSEKPDEADCAAQDGCSWVQVGTMCTGTCMACSQFGSSSDCGAQQGCFWRPGRCQGTPDPCDGRSWFDCQDGCSWVPGYCTGGNVDCSRLGYQSRCELFGCTWDDREEECTGTGVSCSDISGGLACWGAGDPCQWIDGYCEGPPDACHTVSSARDCQRDGCTWEVGICDGGCEPCAGFADETTCVGQQGCSWEPVFACQGGCTPCGDLGDEASCQAQDGCSWRTGAGCSGTCEACETFASRVECEAQPGCRWE